MLFKIKLKYTAIICTALHCSGINGCGSKESDDLDICCSLVHKQDRDNGNGDGANVLPINCVSLSFVHHWPQLCKRQRLDWVGGQQQDILWKGLNCFQEKDDKSESLLPPRQRSVWRVGVGAGW